MNKEPRFRGEFHTVELGREKGFDILRVNGHIAHAPEQLLLQVRPQLVEELLVEGQQTLIGIGVPRLLHQVEREGPFERYLFFHGQTAVSMAKRGLGLRD